MVFEQQFEGFRDPLHVRVNPKPFKCSHYLFNVGVDPFDMFEDGCSLPQCVTPILWCGLATALPLTITSPHPHLSNLFTPSLGVVDGWQE